VSSPNPARAPVRRKLRSVAAALAVVLALLACSAPPHRASPSPGRAGSGAVVLVLDNQLDQRFRTVALELTVDGRSLMNCAEPGRVLAARSPQVLWQTTLPPGPHHLAARLTWRPVSYGVFAYLQNYRFESRGSLDAVVPPDRDGTLTVFAYESGGVATPIEDRVRVRLELHLDVRPEGPAAGCPLVPDDTDAVATPDAG
jgi:hypothetical protein